MGSIFDVVTKVIKSKGLILGWLTFALGLFSYLGNDQWIAQYPAVTAGIITAVGALQVVVRWLTVLPLSEK